MRPCVTVNVSVWIGWTCASGTAPPGRSASSNASRSPPLLAAVSMKVNRSPVTGFSSVWPGRIGRESVVEAMHGRIPPILRTVYDSHARENARSSRSRDAAAGQAA
jgi:hypothetical protein